MRKETLITILSQQQDEKQRPKGVVRPSKRSKYLARRIRPTERLPFIVTTAEFHGEETAIIISNPRGFTTGERQVIEANDIAIILMETNDQPIGIISAGWQEVANSPVINTSTRLTAYWKRISDDEPNVETTDSGEHQSAIVVWVRGCLETGDPFDFTNSATGSGTAITIDGGSTTKANTFAVIGVAVNGDTLDAVTFSGWANDDLQNVTERFDVVSDSFGGIGIATAEKRTKGILGNTTVTQEVADTWAGWIGVLKPRATKHPAIASMDFTQTVAGSQLNPAEYRNGDLMLLYTESDAGTPTISSPTGWTLCNDCPVVSGDTTLSVWWKRLTDVSTEVFPTLSGYDDHILSRIIVVRGAIRTGDPFDFQGAGGTGSGTSVTIIGDTTTVNNCTFLAFVSTSNFSLETVYGWTNLDVTSFVERQSQITLLSNRGSSACAGGYVPTPSLIGSTTATLSTTLDWASWRCAIKPQA